MKKNLVNISVNTTHTPVPVDHNALTGKESKMKKDTFEFDNAVEGILLNSLFGFSFPLIVTFTGRLQMAPGDTAFLVCLVAALTAVMSGMMSGDCKSSKVRFLVDAHHVVCACLTGTALFRCLVEGFGDGLPVDYQSLPCAVVVAVALSLQLAAAKAFAVSIKK